MTGWQIDAWRTARRASGIAAATVLLQTRYVQRFAEVHRSPEAVEPLDLSLWLDQWDAPETRKSALTALRGYFRWAMLTGVAEADPTARVATVRVPRGRPHPVRHSVVLAALDQATEPQTGMILLALTGGLRRAEVARVAADDIEGRVLTVVGKGSKYRAVPICDALADVDRRARLVEAVGIPLTARGRETDQRRRGRPDPVPTARAGLDRPHAYGTGTPRICTARIMTYAACRPCSAISSPTTTQIYTATRDAAGYGPDVEAAMTWVSGGATGATAPDGP